MRAPEHDDLFRPWIEVDGRERDGHLSPTCLLLDEELRPDSGDGLPLELARGSVECEETSACDQPSGEPPVLAALGSRELRRVEEGEVPTVGCALGVREVELAA